MGTRNVQLAIRNEGERRGEEANVIFIIFAEDKGKEKA